MGKNLIRSDRQMVSSNVDQQIIEENLKSPIGLADRTEKVGPYEYIWLEDDDFDCSLPINQP